MEKSDAIAIFGTTRADLARALGISSQAISQWPEVLDQERIDRVIGAAMRLNKTLPKGVIPPTGSDEPVAAQSPAPGAAVEIPEGAPQ